MVPSGEELLPGLGVVNEIRWWVGGRGEAAPGGMLVLLLLGASAGLAPSGKCPCSDAALCEPVRVQHTPELMGFTDPDAFVAGSWKVFDWRRITTLVSWTPGEAEEEAMCEAHRHSARLIAASPGWGFDDVRNATARKRWVDGAVASISSRFLDGVTFDFEDAVDGSPGSPTRELSELYTLLVRETTAALHAAVPGSQTSVCVPWDPIDSGRDYDYAGLAVGMPETVFDPATMATHLRLTGLTRGVGRCAAFSHRSHADAPLCVSGGLRLALHHGLRHPRADLRPLHRLGQQPARR